MATVPRALHPLAWWGWAIGLAVAASLGDNPLVLALILSVVWFVVVSRRTSSPWARAFRLYVFLAVVIVIARVVLHVLVGLKFGTTRVLPLPEIGLPSWAAGINLLGDVYLEGLLAATLQGVRLGVLVIAVGGANALANPRRLLRSLPNALHEVGTAVVVAVSVAPQLAESVQRVMRARLLRGEAGRGLRAVPQVALPVLQDTLDRSLLLAASMESRGYGSHHGAAGDGAASWTPRRVATGALTLTGLLAIAFGMYGVLDPTRSPGWSGAPVLALGLALAVAGLVLGGREIRVTTYRPDAWGWSETVTVLTGVAAAAGAVASLNTASSSMLMPLQPLAAPGLPTLATLGILLAALPAFATPPTPEAVRVR